MNLLFVVLTIILIFLCGCENRLEHKKNEAKIKCNGSLVRPSYIDKLHAPLILFAKGESGIMLKDSDGCVISISSNYTFSRIIMESDIKVGSIIQDRLNTESSIGYTEDENDDFEYKY